MTRWGPCFGKRTSKVTGSAVIFGREPGLFGQTDETDETGDEVLWTHITQALLFAHHLDRSAYVVAAAWRRFGLDGEDLSAYAPGTGCKHDTLSTSPQAYTIKFPILNTSCIFFAV